MAVIYPFPCWKCQGMNIEEIFDEEVGSDSLTVKCKDCGVTQYTQ